MSQLIEQNLKDEDRELAPYFREYFAEWGRRPHPFTPHEYQVLLDNGFFADIRDHVDLVGGQIRTTNAREGVKFTDEQIYRMMDLHLFEEIRFELIDGEIIEMAAQKNFHAISIDNTRDQLALAFGPSFWVRVQATLDLSPLFVPDPDLAVVPLAARRLSTNPTTALLVVEVSLTTLRYDRNRKAELYAAAGIADYWIVNLVDNQLEIMRNPQPEPSSRSGFRYASPTILLPADFATPLAAPAAKIAVADLLP
jgi:Uma2 family endonuclease